MNKANISYLKTVAKAVIIDNEIKKTASSFDEYYHHLYGLILTLLTTLHKQKAFFIEGLPQPLPDSKSLKEVLHFLKETENLLPLIKEK